jgi:hypothetical protein
MATREKDRNPYLGWSLARLERHRQKIDDAIVNAEQKMRERRLKVDNEFGPDFFYTVHSDPSCQLISVKVGEKDVEWNKQGETIHFDYFVVQCATHNVKSAQFSR